jgi:hypothetical protein
LNLMDKTTGAAYNRRQYHFDSVFMSPLKSGPIRFVSHQKFQTKVRGNVGPCYSPILHAGDGQLKFVSEGMIFHDQHVDAFKSLRV